MARLAVTARRQLVGLLGTPRTAAVDSRGRLEVDRATWWLDWWIGADDRWRAAEREVAVRQSLVDGMPVVETAMRVPGGDARHRVYGAGADGSVVVEIENQSPLPFVAAFVVRGASQLAIDGTAVMVDGHRALVTARPPSRWAVSADGTTFDVVGRGEAMSGPFPPSHDRAARLVAAFLHPVPHRAVVRAVVPLARRDLAEVEVGAFSRADEVVRGWRAQLGRGARVVLPDEQLQTALDRARAATLLAGQSWETDGVCVAALEDWGFDAEAADAWRRLRFGQRRRAARRSRDVSWEELAARAYDPPELLLALRSLLLRDDPDGTLVALPAWPSAWQGLGLEVHDLPTRRGPVSFAVRWHGERPAVLWEIPAGARLRMPGLDPAWVTHEPHGETLLCAP